MAALTPFGKARRAYLADAKRAGHSMGNESTLWAKQPWDKDDSGVYRSSCCFCDYEVQMFEETEYVKSIGYRGTIKTFHFKRVDAGRQDDIDSMPTKCEGRD
jgi:hypothetical protein